jgi:thymidylate synthase
MKEYIDALNDIYENGVDKVDRTGVGTRSKFVVPLHFDLSKGFPAVTTKKLAFKSVLSELLWFLEGSNEERRLAEILYGKPRSELTGKRTIWTANAEADYWSGKSNPPNDVGRIYGSQWRDFDGVDQISVLVDSLKNNPDSRRHILSAWNPGELNEMCLPPCHLLSQFYVHDGALSCHMYQRSCDMFLGVPFNIASYALLTHMLAHVCGYEVNMLHLTLGDAHIYHTHIDQYKEQVKRVPYTLPVLEIKRKVTDVFDFRMEDFELVNYKHHPSIKAEMAV